MTTTERSDIYSRVTGQIIAAIEAGAAEFRMPWHVTGADHFSPVNAFSKRPYRGVNVLCLWAAAEANGYPTGIWGTYKQWSELGAQVRKGEESSLIVFWKLSKWDEEAGEEGEDEGERGTRLFARGYSVFNAAQVDGYTPAAVPILPESERIESAESFFSSLGADIRPGGKRAFYRPVADHIQMPRFEAFKDGIAYYATLAHEMTHHADIRIMPHRGW